MPKENKPGRIALEVESQFTASHTLAGFETPHFHLWKVRAQFETALPLASDRVMDLVQLQTVMEGVLAPLANRYLNDHLSISPTTENLCLWVWEHLSAAMPDAPLSEIRIQICDLEGVSTGSARVFR